MGKERKNNTNKQEPQGGGRGGSVVKTLVALAKTQNLYDSS